MNRILKAVLIQAAGLGIAALWSPLANATLWEVSITNFSFAPAGLHIITGDVILWTNFGSLNHTSTSDTGVWNSGILIPNETFSFTFDNPGTYPYHCAVHLSMKDTIFVTSPTGIDDESPSAPSQFELLQNYPNPFNAQTAIAYALPHYSHVRIAIYNLLGQTIETLVDRDQSAGYHRVLWDASNAPTGVYFYRIEAAGLVQTRKMTLVK